MSSLLFRITDVKHFQKCWKGLRLKPQSLCFKKQKLYANCKRTKTLLKLYFILNKPNKPSSFKRIAKHEYSFKKVSFDIGNFSYKWKIFLNFCYRNYDDAANVNYFFLSFLNFINSLRKYLIFVNILAEFSFTFQI